MFLVHIHAKEYEHVLVIGGLVLSLRGILWFSAMIVMVGFFPASITVGICTDIDSDKSECGAYPFRVLDIVQSTSW